MTIINKKPIIITIIAIIIALGVFALFYRIIQNKKTADLNTAQTKMTNSFKETAFNTTYNASTSNLKGTLDKSLNFQGDILSNGKVVQNIVKVGDKVYTKSPDKNTWLVQKNPLFLSQINTMAHPEYITLKKYLKYDKDGNSEYTIVYNQMAKNLELQGTAVLDKQTGQLKEFKLQQGKENKNEVVIEYNINSSPSVITEPKT